VAKSALEVSLESMSKEQIFARFDELWNRGSAADRKEMEVLIKIVRKLEGSDASHEM
jgi:hypothetical protein